MSLNKIIKKKSKVSSVKATKITQDKLISFAEKSSVLHKKQNEESSHNWIIEKAIISYLPKVKIDTNEYLNKSNKIVLNCFDLDGTIITTKSKGRKFAISPYDWQWLNENILKKLEDIKRSKENGIVVIFTNQGSVITTSKSKNQKSASLTNFQTKITDVIRSLEMPDLHLYGCPKASAIECRENPLYADKNNLINPFANNRKPNAGMWSQLLNYLNISSDLIDFDKSVFVGDAAGRPGDFSDSDIRFAEKIGLKFYTPEEYFSF